MPNYDYDMIVIGSGPAGQRAAIQAAKVDKKAAVIEKRSEVGGVCSNTGTIPSKTLREAVLRLSGLRDRSLYGTAHTAKERITMDDLLYRVGSVMRHENDVIRNQLHRNDVELIHATATFMDPHRIRLSYADGAQREVTAEFVVIATGTVVAEADEVPFNKDSIHNSDEILQVKQLPKRLTVVGGGVVGLEYASIFAALGVRVTVIDKREQLLQFADREMVDALIYQLRDWRVTFRLGEEVKSLELSDQDDDGVIIRLTSGKEVRTEQALYSIGRMGATASLNLGAAGLVPGKRMRLEVNEHYQTETAHIYAVGDVIGFPSLAATAMEQGRLAACHAFNLPAASVPELFPYGIYTIPEISMVGKNESELTKAGVSYEVGKAQYREIARSKIIGDAEGLLKLIFHLETRELLGVHIIGDGASELVHIGQAVMSFKGTIDYFLETVFNYPTLAECYKTAAFDGINRLKL